MMKTVDATTTLKNAAFEIDAAYVAAHLEELAGNEDLSRYILFFSKGFKQTMWNE